MKTAYNPKIKNDEIEKSKARKITVDQIASTFVTAQILSLPNFKFLMEKMLLKVSHNFKFTCCEFDDQIFFKMLEFVGSKKLPFFDIRCKALGEIIFESAKESYAHIIADYCGTFNMFAPELEHVMKNNILKVGGTLSITMTKRMPKPEINHYKRMCKIRKQVKGTTKTEHALNVMTEQFPNYKTVKVYHYKNMVLYIVKRIK